MKTSIIFYQNLTKKKYEKKNMKLFQNKTFELICNISLNRNIKIKSFKHGGSEKINSFFHLDEKIKLIFSKQIHIFQKFQERKKIQFMKDFLITFCSSKN